MKRKLLVVCCLSILICAVSSYAGYNLGVRSGAELYYEKGHRDGYSEGEAVGFRSGNMTGFQIGEGEGFVSGYAEGYDLGYSEGFASGKLEGFSEGNATGFTDGYVQGVDSGFAEGRTAGYNLGFSEGNETGFSTGYVRGVEDGAGRGWNIRDPTFSEAVDFIKTDRTDENEYSENYTCFHFTADLEKNAFNIGFRCGLVYIEFPEGAHAIVSFNTTDKNLVFVEPQSDDLMKLVVGEPYWDRAIFPPPDYDDTIVSFTIVW